MADTEVSTHCPLLSLPAELRNRIYRFAVIEEESIRIDSTNGFKRNCLLSTCKQVRSECLKIYYYESTFRLYAPALDTAILQRRFAEIFKLELDHEEVYTSVSDRDVFTKPNWWNLLHWCHLYHAGEVPYAPASPERNEETGQTVITRYVVGGMFQVVEAMRVMPWANVEELLVKQRPTLVAIDRRWRSDRGRRGLTSE